MPPDITAETFASRLLRAPLLTHLSVLRSNRKAMVTYVCLAMLSYPQVKIGPSPDRAATRTLCFNYDGPTHSCYPIPTDGLPALRCHVRSVPFLSSEHIKILACLASSIEPSLWLTQVAQTLVSSTNRLPALLNARYAPSSSHPLVQVLFDLLLCSHRNSARSSLISYP